MKLRFLIPFLFAAPLQLLGQTCTTSVCNVPANANDAVFLNALPSSCPGPTVINVPTGTGVWTNQVTYSIPASCTDLTMQGASTVTFTGTHGTASYAISSHADNTVIQDNIAGTFGVLQINLSPTPNAKFRMTGMTLVPGTGTQKSIGYVLFYATVPSLLRVDHNHYAPIGGPTSWGGRITGCITGVMDHNLIDSASPTDTTSQTQFYMNLNTCSSSDPWGDGTFAASTSPAETNTMEYADNIDVGGFFLDCVGAGSFLARYNTINSDSHISSRMHTHGTAQNGGRTRSCRWSDVNNNYFNSVTPGVADIGLSGATGVAWFNAMSNVTQTVISIGDERNDGGHPQTPVPNGWGTCGSTAGGPSNWDGNNPSTSGWPCLDGLGRGQTAQALNGQNFPTAFNSITGTETWPQQYLEPIYAWGNNLNGSGTVLLGPIGGSATLANRDVYVDNASFTGATGTGSGLSTSRPTNCTPGPGGANGASPGGGSRGVAWFNTDLQRLDVCTATNTWTNAVYTPPIYPNPLITGTAFTWTPTTTNGSLTGTNCSSGSYPTGTPIGACTAVPNTGYSFSSWSGVTGSATCSGATNPCPVFNLSANSAATANFTVNSYNLTTTTAGLGSGSVTGGSCAGAHNYNTGWSCTLTASGGSTLTGASGCGGTLSGTTYSGNMPAGSCVVTATFTLNPTWTVTAVNGSITGTNCGNGTYPAGTIIGSCTAVPNTGYSFTSWSGVTGSATCAGSIPCPAFPLNVNSAAIANFTINTWTLSTATTGTGSAVISGCAGAHNYNTAYSCTITPAPGSSITSVSGCGGSGTSPFTGLMPNSNCAVSASIQGTAAAPTFSPGAGSYGSTQTVSLFDTTPGAVIHYTTNGSTPTSGSPTYSTPITVAASLTIKAIAIATGYTNSPVASAAYVISNVLPAPSFFPGAGTYGAAQNVAISSSLPVAAFTGSEGSNGNASNGSSPTRNAYTNCATSCISGVWQPPNSGSVSNGQLACTTAAQASGVTNGCTARSVVAVTSSGSGLSALANGFGAGGDDSLTAMTYTYGGASAGDCSGAPANSLLVPSITFPSNANQREILAGTTDATNFNTSFLNPTKFATPGTDGAQWGIMRTCVTVPDTSSNGWHYESEPNQTLSTHDRFDYGGHYVFSTSKWYFAGHSASWVALNLVEADGTVHTTTPFPAGHHMYIEDLYYRTAACTSSSGSNCMFWVAKAIEDFTAGTPAVLYNLIDSTTGLIPGDVPDSQPSFPEQSWSQTQGDFDASAVSRQFNIDIKSFTTFSAPTICYTLDGSTPTGDGDGNCTHGTRYTLPVLVSSSLTIKAIATQHGQVDSSVGSAAYVIGASATWTQTVVGTGTITGTNSTTGSYLVGTTIGPLTATAGTGYTFTGWSAVSGNAACSGTTNPCPSFVQNINSAATATFTVNSYTVSTATTGSGSGTITGCAGAHNFGTSVSCTITPTGGSTVVTVAGCGGTWSTSPYTFTQGAANCTVTATFSAPAPTNYIQLSGLQKHSGTEKWQ